MALRLARTNAEAHLYMELNPCDICGAGEFAPDSGVMVVEGDLASQYAGTCPRCGVPREFVFRIPEEVILPDPEEPTFGDDRPSELVDAGQWLAYADRLSRGVPAEPFAGMTAGQRQRARLDLLTAAAAVAEVRKFIPAGADAVPRDAVWTEAGLAEFDRQPGRFHRRRLEVVRRTYRDLAQRFRT